MSIKKINEIVVRRNLNPDGVNASASTLMMQISLDALQIARQSKSTDLKERLNTNFSTKDSILHNNKISISSDDCEINLKHEYKYALEMYATCLELSFRYSRAYLLKFKEFAELMSNDLKTSIESIQDHLCSWYIASLKKFEGEGIDISNMTPPELIDCELTKIIEHRTYRDFSITDEHENNYITYEDENINIINEHIEFHIELGAQTFHKFARTVSKEIGWTISTLRNYLEPWYEFSKTVLDSHGIDVSSMDPPDAVKSELKRLIQAERRDTQERAPNIYSEILKTDTDTTSSKYKETESTHANDKYSIANEFNRNEESEALIAFMNAVTLACITPLTPFDEQRLFTDADKDAITRIPNGPHDRLDVMGRYYLEQAIQAKGRYYQDKAREKRYPELKERFDKFSDAAKDVYTKVRDTYEKRRQEAVDQIIKNAKRAVEMRLEMAKKNYAAEMEEAGRMSGAERKAAEKAAETKLYYEEDRVASTMRARIYRLRKQLERNKITGDYFHLHRNGNFTVIARDPSGKVVSFSRTDSAGQQDKIAERLKEEYPDHEITKGAMETSVGDLQKVDPKFVANVIDIVDGPSPGSTSPEWQIFTDALRDQIWQEYLRSLPDLSMRKSRFCLNSTSGAWELIDE